MGKFKDLQEANNGQPYVVVRNNQVELRKSNVSGPVQLFAQGAVSAILSGDAIIVTFKDGKVGEYRLNPGNNTVNHVRTV